MEAIEKIIQTDKDGNAILQLGKKFSSNDSKVIVIFKDETITDQEWLSAAIKGKAYDFLNDDSENIYTSEDGIAYK